MCLASPVSRQRRISLMSRIFSPERPTRSPTTYEPSWRPTPPGRSPSFRYPIPISLSPTRTRRRCLLSRPTATPALTARTQSTRDIQANIPRRRLQDLRLPKLRSYGQATSCTGTILRPAEICLVSGMMSDRALAAVLEVGSTLARRRFRHFRVWLVLFGAQGKRVPRRRNSGVSNSIGATFHMPLLRLYDSTLTQI